MQGGGYDGHHGHGGMARPGVASCGTGQGQRALRAGRWTKAEEMYAAQLVIEFNSGLLPMPDGRMLRMFLAKALNCDPMRISKKFVGNSAIGKQV